MLPKEKKWANAVTALIGVLFSAAASTSIQLWLSHSSDAPGAAAGLHGNTMLVDHFAIYFFYLFLAATAIAILMSVRYLETEHENHGEYYALMLLSVAGMMCMAAGFDIVLIFIGLELMAISTYVLVGFLRRDRRSNEAALKYLLLGAFSSGIFAYGLSLFYGLTGSTNLGDHRPGTARHVLHNEYRPVAIIALTDDASPDCCSRSPPSHSTSGHPTPTKARPPASPDSCRSRSRPRDGPCCCAFLHLADSCPCAPSGSRCWCSSRSRR